jgi:hypothetical protein
VFTPSRNPASAISGIRSAPPGPHSDGEGFNLKLAYLPLNGAEIVIRKPKADEVDATAAG